MTEKRKPEIPALKNIDSEYLKAIKKLRFIDDNFMVKIFEDIPCTEFLLQQILEREDLVVKTVKSQYAIKGLKNRGVCLDVFAVDKDSKLYNIEIQRNNKGAILKRARYNSSLIDAHMTNPGDDYKDLYDTYVIFITENDVFKKGLPIYNIEKVIKETGDFVDDGSHIVYVNGTIRDETALGWVMHDFFCTDPNEMHYKVFANRTRFFKETKEGVSQMCQIMEDFWEKGRKEGREEGREELAKEIAFNLAKQGLAVNSIALAVKQSVPVVESWIKEAGAAARQ